jgi:hypothetical protein
LSLVLAWTGAAASDDDYGVHSAPSAAPSAGQRLYRVSRIVGSGVHDAHEKRIGEVKDLILGSARGDIAYAVIGFGSVLGIGGRYYPVPWQALQASDDGSYYVLQVDPQTISRAPGFDRGNWPDFADRGWSTEVDRYWARMVGRGAGQVNRLSSGISGSHSMPETPGAESSGTGQGAGGSHRGGADQ